MKRKEEHEEWLKLELQIEVLTCSIESIQIQIDTLQDEIDDKDKEIDLLRVAQNKIIS